jgi:hypothetical protein
MGQLSFRHIKEREYIRSEGALELHAGDLGKIILGVLLGGVIHEDVETPERTYGVLHDLLAEGLIADIAAHGDTAQALSFHHAARLLCVAVLAQVGDRHIGSFFGKGDGDSAADAAISS